MTGRRNRRKYRKPLPFQENPVQSFLNPYRPLEVLPEGELEKIHRASMYILENIGIEFHDDEALDLLENAGAKVDRDGKRVRMGRDFVLETVAKAPSEFNLRARNPARSVTIGGNHINFVTCAGMPYFSDLDGGRRPGTLSLYQRMLKLAQMCSPIHIVEGVLVEPQDVPIAKRHLEKGFNQLTMTDKVYHTASHGREICRDYLEMAAIVFGGHELIQREPVFGAVVNANSPLKYDDRMLGGLITYARAGQCNVITPFILAGAMSPITMAAALTQQNAEALAGIVLTQLVKPGCPVVYGGFTTSVDMQTGSPSFGNPEGALALLAGAQLARRYELPYRGSGSLNNAKSVDAQAAIETQWTLWPAVMAHANLIVHAAGWLEGGLVCSMEKFILDMEGLAMMQHFMAGIEINEETLALDSIAEVGPGGHHFGTSHTLGRYKNEFYSTSVGDRQNFDNWRDNGSEDAVVRANKIAKELINGYEPPPMAVEIYEELTEFVERRKRESKISYY